MGLGAHSQTPAAPQLWGRALQDKSGEAESGSPPGETLEDTHVGLGLPPPPAAAGAL